MLNRKVIKILFLSATGFVLSFLAVNVFALSINGKNFVEFKRNPKVDFSTDFAQKVTECNDRRSCGGIILPAGNFYLDRSIGINNGISISGAGTGKTILTIGYKVKGFVFNSGAEADNLELKGLTLNFNSANKNEKVGGINIRNSNNLNLQDIEIINPPYIGLNIVGSSTDKTICSGLNLQNIKIVGTGATTSNAVVINSCSNILLDNINISASKKDGIYFNKVSSTTIINSSFDKNLSNALEFNLSDKILIKNSTTSNSLSGIQITSTTTNFVISSSTITNNSKHGIFANSKSISDLNILTNIISNNASTGIYISGGKKVDVVGNTIKFNTENGVYVTNIQNININDNKIGGNKNTGITLGKAATFVTMKNNSISDTGLANLEGDKSKSIALYMVNGVSNVVLDKNLVYNTATTTKTDFGLKVDAGVQKVFASDNSFASSTKDIDINASASKVCVYGDPKMLRWQKFVCWFDSVINSITLYFYSV